MMQVWGLMYNERIVMVLTSQSMGQEQDRRGRPFKQYKG